MQVGSEATPSGKFIIQNVAGSAVAAIDSTGNATFSGTVNSNQLTVNSNASVSGTLYADNIKSKSLDDIQKLLSRVEAILTGTRPTRATGTLISADEEDNLSIPKTPAGLVETIPKILLSYGVFAFLT